MCRPNVIFCSLCVGRTSRFSTRNWLFWFGCTNKWKIIVTGRLLQGRCTNVFWDVSLFRFTGWTCRFLSHPMSQLKQWTQIQLNPVQISQASASYTGNCQLDGPSNTLFSVTKQGNDVIFRHISITLNTTKTRKLLGSESVMFSCSCSCGYSGDLRGVYPWSFGELNYLNEKIKIASSLKRQIFI